MDFRRLLSNILGVYEFDAIDELDEFVELNSTDDELEATDELDAIDEPSYEECTSEGVADTCFLLDECIFVSKKRILDRLWRFPASLCAHLCLQ